MNNQHDPFVLALLSWAYWISDIELIKELTNTKKIPAKFSAPENFELIVKIASALYYSTSQDTFANSNVYNRNWVDKLYLELAKKIGKSPSAFWPEGKQSALIISHDIDRIKTTYQHLSRAYRKGGLVALVKALFAGNKENPDPFTNFATVCETEKRWGLSPTVMILKEKPRYRKLLQGEVQHCLGVYDPAEIKSEVSNFKKIGGEIGLHYSFDSFHDLEAFRSEKHYIEKCYGLKIEGGRSHYLNFSQSTLDILLSEGFEYDSTLGFNFTSGFRCGTAFPFVLGHSASKLLWEVPLHLMDTTLMYQESHLGKNWQEVEKSAIEITDSVLKAGGVLCINLHQRFFNPTTQPKLMSLIERIVESCREKNVWMPTLLELTTWWKRRHQAVSNQTVPNQTVQSMQH